MSQILIDNIFKFCSLCFYYKDYIMRGLPQLIVGIMMLALPSLMSSLVGAMPDPGTTTGHFDAIALQLQSNILSILSPISYITGIGFGIIGIVKFREELDGGVSHSTYTPVQEVKKVEVPKEEVKKPVIVEKPTTSSLEMEDKALNEKVKAIIDKINVLLQKELIQKDIQNRMLLIQTRDEYLPKIAKHYTTIPKEMRNKSVQGNLTANDMAHKQLDLILDAVEEVEDNVLNEQTKEMRVMERFLKNKFDLEEESIIDFDKIKKNVDRESEKELNS